MTDYTQLGKFYILNNVDHFSKFHFGKAFETKETKNVVDFLRESFRRLGKPKYWLSDNGGEFTSDAVEALMKELKVEVGRSRSRL